MGEGQGTTIALQLYSAIQGKSPGIFLPFLSGMNGGVIKVEFAENDNVGLIVSLSEEYRELAGGCTHSNLKPEILLFRRTIEVVTTPTVN